MGSRYLITGIQLGMIGSFVAYPKEVHKESIEKLLDEVLTNQWIGYSDNNIQNDVSKCQLTTIALLKERADEYH